MGLKKQKQGGSQKPAAQAAEPTPAEKERQAEWDRLTKFPEYWAKMEELRLTDKNHEELHGRAVTALQALMSQEAWFGDNTPYPFKVTHWSQIASVAHLACRYLRTVALGGNQDAIQTLARLTVDMAGTLTEMTVEAIDSLQSPLRVQSAAAKRNAKLVAELKRKFGPRCSADYFAKSNMEIFRELARTLPYWPVLYSKIPAGNSHLPLLVDQLEVGKACPIRISENANYSLQTPMNALLYYCLKHFESVHSSIRRMLKRNPFPGWPFRRSGWHKMGFHKPEASSLKQAFARLGFVHPADIQIYRKSFKLPPLTRDTAPQWANVAIIPFVKARFPSYIPTGKSGKPREGDFRKLVIQQLSVLHHRAPTSTPGVG